MTCKDCYWYQHENCEGTNLSPRYCRTFIVCRNEQDLNNASRDAIL